MQPVFVVQVISEMRAGPVDFEPTPMPEVLFSISPQNSIQNEIGVEQRTGSSLEHDKSIHDISQQDSCNGNKTKDCTSPGWQETVSLKSSRRSLSVKDVILVAAGFVVFLFPQGLGNSYGVVYTHLKLMENLTDYQVSWIGSLMSGLNGVGAPLGSHLIAVVGCRWTSLIGGILVVMGIVISSFVSNINILYFSLGVLPGVGTAISQLSAIVSISRHFDRGRPLALGFVSTGGAVGMLSFPLLWSLVLESLEWQKGLLVVGGVAASITLASLTFSSNGKVEVGKYKKFAKKAASSPSYTSFFKNSSYIFFLVSIFLGGVSLFIYGSYIPEFAGTTITDPSPTKIAIAVSAMGAGSFVGRILLSSLAMTSSRAPLLIYTAALALCGVSNGLTPFSTSYVLLICNSAVQGCFLGGWTTMCPLVAASLFGPDVLPKSLGMAYLFMGLGCVTGPPIAGALAEMTQKMKVLFFFAAGGYLASAIFLLPLYKAQGSIIKDKEIEISKEGKDNPGFAEGG